MESITSTEFVLLNHVAEENEWLHPTRLEYQVAVVAQQVFRIGAMLGSGGNKVPGLDEFIVSFQRKSEATTPDIYHDEKGRERLVNLHDFAGGGGLPGIELGAQPLDPHWDKVNTHAKNAWLMLVSHLPEGIPDE